MQDRLIGSHCQKDLNEAAEYFSQVGEHDNRSDRKESCILQVEAFHTVVAKSYSSCVHTTNEGRKCFI